MKLREIQLVLINEFGEFRGQKATLNDEQYSNLLKLTKEFHQGAGFELTLEDGTFVVFPSDIVQKSILKVTNKIIQDV
jgi:hypothetical protein